MMISFQISVFPAIDVALPQSVDSLYVYHAHDSGILTHCCGGSGTTKCLIKEENRVAKLNIEDELGVRKKLALCLSRSFASGGSAQECMQTSR